jgi:hypothetical protein
MHWFWRAVIALCAILLGLGVGFGLWVGLWHALDPDKLAESTEWFFEPRIPPTGRLFVCAWLGGFGVTAAAYLTIAAILRSSRLRLLHARKWVILLAASVVGWLASNLFDIRHFGEAASFALAKGCAGVYWGDDFMETNTSLGNPLLAPDCWPEFPGGFSGAGIDATTMTWLDGPPATTRCEDFSSAWRDGVIRERLGLKWPLVHTSTFGTHCVVVPLWIPILLSGTALGWCGRRLWQRPANGHCHACGYDLTGNVSGVCPECGTPVPPPASAPPGNGVH